MSRIKQLLELQKLYQKLHMGTKTNNKTLMTYSILIIKTIMRKQAKANSNT